MRPDQVLRKQADLLAALGTNAHAAYAGQWFSRHIGLELRNPNSAESGRQLYALGKKWCTVNAHNIAQAPAYLVDADAVPLIRRAAADLPDTAAIHPHDLPSPRGFLIFAEPYELVDVHGKTRAVRAVSWEITDSAGIEHMTMATGYRPDPAERHGTVVVVFWTSFGDRLTREALLSVRTDPDNRLVRELGDLTSVHQVSIPLELPLADWETYREGQEYGGDATGGPILGVMATWMLMRQPVLAGDEVPMTRKRRQHWQRTQQIPGHITVVRLRHRPSAAAPQPAEGQTAASWSCRWRVHGHWHRYRTGTGRANTEWRYVHDYDKGPEGLPLRDTPRRVYRVTGEPAPEPEEEAS